MDKKPCVRCGTHILGRHRSAKLCVVCAYSTDKLRNKSRSMVTVAIHKGKIPHPSTLVCVDCGKQATCYDHRNYYEPLNVDPVCKSCDCLRGPGHPPFTIDRTVMPKWVTKRIEDSKKLRKCRNNVK